MPNVVTTAELSHLLSEWSAGRMTAAAVHDWAVRRYAVTAFETEDDVVCEVLARLDMLDANLTTVDDIPGVQRLLLSEPHGLADAVKLYEEYLKTLDLHQRKRRLASDPVYAPF